MTRKMISTALIVTTLGLSSVAMAQPGQPDQGPQNGQPAKMQQQPGNGENGHSAPPGHTQNSPQQTPKPHQDWKKGHQVPQHYRDDRYAISDWRQHDLPAPARGQRWMEVNGDYVLMAVATGVIASIIIGHH